MLPARAAAVPTTYAGPLGVPAQSSFDPLDTGAPVQVRTLSGRADLVSGGDTLVEIAVPAGTALEHVKMTAGSRDVTGAFRPAGPGLRGLVTGLPLGSTPITATLGDGTSARLVVKNASQSGPVFSGPLITPWTCRNGATTPDCAQAPHVVYLYKSTDPTKAGVPIQTPVGSVGASSLQPYDPANPPSDVANTTTDNGKTVPFIVRYETGYSLRDQYRIAALWDPAQGKWPDPTAANPGFANKLVLTHGVSCDTAYESGSAPEVLVENALRQGFAVASHALDYAGHNCNLVTQAESLIMVKEMVAERFGPIRYTIGSGCSGGSLVQQQVANAYPGVYQGITPQCSFTDAWSSAQQYVDYIALRAYLENPATLLQPAILPVQWPGIYGHLNPANQITFTTAIANSGDPSRACPGVPEARVYNENTNPGGVRCALHDYMRNVFGVYETGPDKGKARRPISTVGVQYGLSGLQTFLRPETADPTRPPLTPDQFVALNANVGSYDLDWNHTTRRVPADPVAMQRVYRSGAANTAAHLDRVAIIDLGGPEPGAFHDIYRKHSMRARLIREHGTAANQVFWEGQTPLLGDLTFADDAVTKMDDWLAAVESDARAVPLPQKIIAAKAKAGIAERCVSAASVDVPAALCRTTVDATLFSSPRIEAGGGDQALVNGVGPAKVGFADDRLDCQTLPLENAVYGGRRFAEVFTAAQQATLRTTFPTGVCDYSKPGNGFQAAVPWLTYQDGAGKVVYGGAPMGASPASFKVAGAATTKTVLPATGGGSLPIVAVALLATAAFLRRSRTPTGPRSPLP
jgi:hypothetical protein